MLVKVVQDFLSFNSCSKFCLDRFDDRRCSGMTPSFEVMLGAAAQQLHPRTLHPTKCCFKHNLFCRLLPVRVVDDISPWL